MIRRGRARRRRHRPARRVATVGRWPQFTVRKTERAAAFPKRGNLERIFRAANARPGNRIDPDQIGILPDSARLQARAPGPGAPRLALLGLEESTAASRQRDKDEGADEIQTNSAR